jgi:hypothetical protein
MMNMILMIIDSNDTMMTSSMSCMKSMMMTLSMMMSREDDGL